MNTTKEQLEIRSLLVRTFLERNGNTPTKIAPLVGL